MFNGKEPPPFDAIYALKAGFISVATIYEWGVAIFLC